MSVYAHTGGKLTVLMKKLLILNFEIEQKNLIRNPGESMHL